MNKQRGLTVSKHIYVNKLNKMSNTKLNDFIKWIGWESKLDGLEFENHDDLVDFLADCMTMTYTQYLEGEYIY